MKQFNFLLFLLLFASTWAGAQRYLAPVFNDVEVTKDIRYGVNATVLLVAQAGQAVPQPLTLDLYTPKGDTEKKRPLVIMLHGGNFLPPQVNGGCGGTNRDGDQVNAAMRLAKMGYVVASANYRLGWNPIDPNQTVRVFTLINAAYRGVQDSRTAIRYFRKSVKEANNPYGIDTTKIVLWGNGTGGYVSLASATLDKITDTYIPGKFVTAAGPMVIEPINGNLDGTTVGITVPGYPGFPVGDTLCYPNHPGYSSSFALGVNLGGALGDSSWIDKSDVPFISYHVPTDPYAPCQTGIVNVPPPINLPVVEVTGSCGAQPIINRLGLNDCFKAANLNDDLSKLARQRNGGIEGLFLFPTKNPTDPVWGYASSLTPYGIPGALMPCDTNSVRANKYLDTIMQYFAPRAFYCLKLGQLSSVETLARKEVGFTMAPNPAADLVTFQSGSSFPMKEIQLFDLNGRLLRSDSNIRNNTYYLQRNNLPPGMYIARVRFDKGMLTERLIFE